MNLDHLLILEAPVDKSGSVSNVKIKKCVKIKIR